MPVIDRGVFHNYVQVCKQLFLCDVIRSGDNLSTSFLRVPHLFIRDEKRKERNEGLTKDHGTVYKPSLIQPFCK